MSSPLLLSVTSNVLVLLPGGYISAVREGGGGDEEGVCCKTPLLPCWTLHQLLMEHVFLVWGVGVGLFGVHVCMRVNTLACVGM